MCVLSAQIPHSLIHKTKLAPNAKKTSGRIVWNVILGISAANANLECLLKMDSAQIVFLDVSSVLARSAIFAMQITL
jgi:uncharacterized protein GlcG (DUF336 family)